MNTDTERVKFIQAGYDVIPLVPSSKSPLRKAWEKRPTVSQWYNAPDNANIGLRAGNGRAFIDCDDKKIPGTSEAVIRWMDGLGYALGTYPLVQTPTSGGVGRHVYVSFAGALLGSRRDFINGFGAGDFRYGAGSFVATFPDYVTGLGEYKLLQGDVTQLPVLDMKDIAALVDINKVVADPKQSKRPSALALATMQGVKLEKYKTNSDGEMGLVLSLHNSGYTYDEIKAVFESCVCLGHYTNEHKAKGAREAERWLRLTYKNAVTYSQESRTRQTIAAWIERAKASAWKKVTDKNLYIAHAEISHKAGKYEHAADVRTLSLLAGVGICTASNGNKRLVKAGGLVVVEPFAGLRATTYKLLEPPQSATLEHILSKECVDVFENGTPKNGTKEAITTHDAFMNGKGRLGRRAGEVYALLLSELLTFAEIQERTGTPTRTLRRILGKLRNVKDRKTGEIIEMVSLGGDGAYCGNIVDLDLVSAIYGTYGATGKRRDEYAKDRRDRARTWELETLTKCGGSVTV
jgi:hypothetical protein